MNFIIGLPRTMKQHDTIMVMVEKIREDANFILIKFTPKLAKIIEIFKREILGLHGMPTTIISDRDSKLTSNF